MTPNAKYRAGSARPSLTCSSGQSLLEFAIAVPFLLLLLVGTFEFGRYMYDAIEISNAARAGAAYAAKFGAGNTTGIAAAAVADAADLGLDPNTDVKATTYCTCDSTQGTNIGSCATFSSCAATDRVDTVINVVVSKNFLPLINYPGLPASLTIARTATQQVSP